MKYRCLDRILQVSGVRPMSKAIRSRSKCYGELDLSTDRGPVP